MTKPQQEAQRSFFILVPPFLCFSVKSVSEDTRLHCTYFLPGTISTANKKRSSKNFQAKTLDADAFSRYNEKKRRDGYGTINEASDDPLHLHLDGAIHRKPCGRWRRKGVPYARAENAGGFSGWSKRATARMSIRNIWRALASLTAHGMRRPLPRVTKGPDDGSFPGRGHI